MLLLWFILSINLLLILLFSALDLYERLRQLQKRKSNKQHLGMAVKRNKAAWQS